MPTKFFTTPTKSTRPLQFPHLFAGVGVFVRVYVCVCVCGGDQGVVERVTNVFLTTKRKQSSVPLPNPQIRPQQLIQQKHADDSLWRVRSAHDQQLCHEIFHSQDVTSPPPSLTTPLSLCVVKSFVGRAIFQNMFLLSLHIA